MRVGATSWRKSNHPTKRFGQLPKRSKPRDIPLYPPLKKPDNSEAIDDAEIAECLADSIETQCSHASPPHDIAHISRIEEEVLQKTSLEPKDDLAPVSLSEVQTLVKSLNTRKAPGLHGISNKAIKCFSIPLLSLLVAIFNACIKNCYFPPAWKEAEVIGIHKPGKPRDLPASYRPISLLSGLGKLFEKILKTRLSDHLLGKGLIIDEQFGFRPAPFLSTASPPLSRSRSSSRLHPLSSAVLRVHKRCTATVVVWRPTRVIRGRYRALYGNRNRSTDSPPPLQRAIDELGQWFRKWRIEVNPDKSAAIQFKYARLGAVLGRKSKLSRRNKRTIYKMCIRTVMTYASPVFAHAAPKALHRLQGLRTPHYFQIYEGRIEAILRHRGITSQCALRAAVDYQPPHPTLIRRPRNVLTDPPDALTAAVESLNDVNDTHD
ncbi:Probable RNA-directed DNA polymerase from transposon BS [Eumeta japonica]|uniref:Probable RNA-directed DNA polymerase from transposon BS n=1 Tax=Eumeta variegata TaxID=151549 RepID=A0A4C1TMQ1_EUMVA|nr:Probable RNA-directed DNA polymerase from transposon BS [Eumeta japonica]